LTNNTPLFSIICFVKNRACSIARCIDSLLAQDYQNIEIIVQDGASTDGTKEILEGYGNKINLVSEPDKGWGDAWIKALNRINGDFFCHCHSDEELLPHAVSWAINQFEKHPDAGAIYGDVYFTDIDGNITGIYNASPWNLEQVLCSITNPPFASTFYKRECFNSDQWSYYLDNCGSWEYEFNINLGIRYPFYYINEIVSKSADHPAQISKQVIPHLENMEHKILTLDRFFARDDLSEKLLACKPKAFAFACLNAAVQCYCNHVPEQSRLVTKKALDYYPDLIKITDAFFSVLQTKLTGKNIYIYGAGQHTECLLAAIDFTQINTKIIGLIDNNPDKWGSSFSGYQVLNPDVLMIDNNHEVLISSVHARKTMTEKVINYGRKPIEIYDSSTTNDFYNLTFLAMINILL